MPVFNQPGRQQAYRERKINTAGCKRAARHTVVLGLFRLLCQREPAVLPDPLQAHRAVGAHPGEHDAGGKPALGGRQGSKEAIDRGAPFEFILGRVEVKQAIAQSKVGSRSIVSACRSSGGEDGTSIANEEEGRRKKDDTESSSFTLHPLLQGPRVDMLLYHKLTEDLRRRTI